MPDPTVLRDLRLAGLYRQVCHAAGVPLPFADPGNDRFVLRTGAEAPDIFAKLLEEAFVEDEAEVVVWQGTDVPDYQALGAGGFAVRPGFDSPCPAADLRRAVGPGRALLFAVERRDAAGRLLSVTWAAVPEDEPPPEAGFRAAVLRRDAGG